MAINSAQRREIQQRSTDAVGFADALRSFGIRTQAETQQILEASAVAVHESIVHGSAITGAPGQPVDTGELRDSWTVKRISSTAFEISTNSPYARAIEHNWRKVRKGHIKAFKLANPKVKRVTKKVRSIIRRSLGGLRFRSGGPHGVRLTAQHFPRLVTALVRELFPSTTRNIGGGVRSSGVGITVPTRSGGRG